MGKLKIFICRILGHKKGFLYKDHDIYFYVCKRCKEIVFEEVVYDEERA